MQVIFLLVFLVVEVFLHVDETSGLDDLFFDKQDNLCLFHGKDDACGKESGAGNHTAEFSYGDGPTGPDNWPTIFTECGGDKQSPINIEMSELEHLKVEPLAWSAGYFVSPGNMTITNNGHTLMLEVGYPKECQASIDGGPLASTYILNNIHFHWGTSNHIGSEHTIDSFAYPLEMHMVHKRKGKSTGSGDRILVVAYFFQVCEKGSSTLDILLDVSTRTVKKLNTRIKLKHYFPLSNLAQPFSFEYITYRGSLTTPPCSESVRWIISPFALDISKKQMEKFRDISNRVPQLKDNYRPTQPINDRTIYFVS